MIDTPFATGAFDVFVTLRVTSLLTFHTFLFHKVLNDLFLTFYVTKDDGLLISIIFAV